MKSGIAKNFSGTLLLSLIGLITGYLVARHLGPEGRGEIAIAFIVTQTTLWLIGFGLS